MKRLFTAVLLVVSGVAAFGVTGNGIARAAGNSDAAHACQQGGYLHLMRTDGTRFANTGECVSYAAHGGTLVAISAPLPTFVLTSPTIIPASANTCWQGATNVHVNLPALWDSHTSGNPGAILCFQGDGNLVIYTAGHVGDPAFAVFNTGTYGNPNAVLAFQSDGNLVIYSDNTFTKALWNSGTSGHPGDCAVFQPDGNLVVYTSCS